MVPARGRVHRAGRASISRRTALAMRAKRLPGPFLPHEAGADRNMAVKLNNPAYDHAQELIAEGRFVFDERDAWSEHRPSAQQENDFIERHGFAEYGKWYLGVNEEGRANQGTLRISIRRFHQCPSLRRDYRRKPSRAIQALRHRKRRGAFAWDDRRRASTQKASAIACPRGSGAPGQPPMLSADVVSG